MQETTATIRQLLLGSRARKWQRWNLTQRVLDTKTSAVDWVPLSFGFGQWRCDLGTWHACVWPPHPALWALFTFPSGYFLTHALRHGNMFISSAVCPGEGLPGREVCMKGLKGDCLLVAKALGPQVPPNEWDLESKWASPWPCGRLAYQRGVSEWENLSGPRKEPVLFGSKVS